MLALVALPALAQAQASGTRVSGSLQAISTGGGSASVLFSCTGEPTCVGRYSATRVDPHCPNPFYTFGAATLTGMDLSRPGPIQVVITLAAFQSDIIGCALSAPAGDATFALPGTWNGSSGSLAGAGNDTLTLAVQFTAQRTVPATTFPLTVSSNITPQTVSATAQVQYRAQDVGTTASVFVFLLAPRSLAHALQLVKDDGDCVLAQVSGGQLVAVTASSMQPALTGVLSAQGASLTLLNNVSTASVAGARVFVGYGPDAATMLSTGVSQIALTVPGANPCSASLARSPGSLSGLFWNPSESGWGIDFTQRGDNVFAAWYTYDTGGNPKWYVSTCAMNSASACSGTLYQVTGPRFFGQAFNPSAVAAAAAGTLQVAFTDNDHASMNYSVGSQTRIVSLERQPFPVGTNAPLIDHTDLWWNPAESGWGVALTQKFQVIFAAWYVYGDSGQPLWYVVPNCPVNAAGNGCTGTLYRTTGPAFGPTFNATAVQPFEAGTATLNFTDANNGTLNYTVNGVTGSKAITRQLF
jgi:hypothetical protein